MDVTLENEKVFNPVPIVPPPPPHPFLSPGARARERERQGEREREREREGEGERGREITRPKGREGGYPCNEVGMFRKSPAFDVSLWHFEQNQNPAFIINVNWKKQAR